MDAQFLGGQVQRQAMSATPEIDAPAAGTELAAMRTETPVPGRFRWTHGIGLPVTPMLFLAAAVTVTTWCGCHDAVDPAVTPGPGLRIATNTQAHWGELNIGIGNIWEAEYSPEDGATRWGLTAGLWLDLEGSEERLTMRVHPGQRITAHGYQIDVLEVEDRAVRILVTAPQPDNALRNVEPQIDSPAGPSIRFSGSTSGEWELLTGHVTQTIGGAAHRREISYRFEVVATTEADLLEIDWSNDDDAREQGAFSVPSNRDLSLEEYLRSLSGPFGDGRIVKVATEQFRIGDRSLPCCRVERRAESREGTHITSLWLSADAPAARVVAYRSRWEPVPEWEVRAPLTVLEVQLSAYGTGREEAWPQ